VYYEYTNIHICKLTNKIKGGKNTMKDDISKRTIVILLVLAVLVSVIGTWIVLTQQPTVEYYPGHAKGSGVVSFAINEDKPVQQVTGESVISLGIKK
jgi:hypothetical protein